MKSGVIKTEDEINDALMKLSIELNEVFCGEQVEMVKMNSAPKMFAQDLSKLLEFEFNFQTLKFESYRNSSIQEVKITKDLSSPIEGKDLVILDGIIISGNTHDYISRILEQRKPKSISIVCIGIKEASKQTSLPKIYSMFSFTKEWVEGYGIGDPQNSVNRFLIDVKNLS